MNFSDVADALRHIATAYNQLALTLEEIQYTRSAPTTTVETSTATDATINANIVETTATVEPTMSPSDVELKN